MLSAAVVIGTLRVKICTLNRILHKPMDIVLFSSIFKPYTKKVNLNREGPLGIYLYGVTFPAVLITCSVSNL